MAATNSINVAVTGNAEFAQFDWNTSWSVLEALPESVNRPGKGDIHIWKYSRVTRDTYDDVRRVSREIWDGKRSVFQPDSRTGEQDSKVDVTFILHFGMIGLEDQKNQFRLEKLARRDGYESPGIDGQHVDSRSLEKSGLGSILYTGFDIDAAGVKVREQFPVVETQLPHVPIHVSDDAGLYLCEFRLYSSLAETFLQESCSGKKGHVAFQHLPQDNSPKAIDLARDIAVAYISALADDRLLDGT